MKPPLYFENPNKPKKRLSPQEWDAQNIKSGYMAAPNEKTGAYKHYYDPNNYAVDANGGFVKKTDLGNPNVDYNNDPTYQPLIKYQEPAAQVNQNISRGEANSGRKAFDFQYSSQGYTGYKYDDGTIKYLNDKGEDLQNYKQPTEIAQMSEGGEFESGNDPVKDQKKWLIDYLNSPKYKERLGKEFPTGLEKELSARKDNLNKVKVSTVDHIGKHPGFILGEYDKGKIQLEKKNNDPDYETIPVHEFGHSVDDGGNRIPKITQDLVSSNTTGDGYYNKPTEFINRLQSIRYLLNKKGLYDAGKENFSPATINKLKADKDILNNQHYKDVMETLNGKDDSEKEKQLILMMNSIAMNNSNEGYQMMNTGGLVKKVKGYWAGGNTTLENAVDLSPSQQQAQKSGLSKDQKLTGLNIIGQGLSSIGGPQDTDMKYGTNAYFDARNKSLQQGQGIANAAGAIPIVGAFKGIGEGLQNTLAKKDAYGVSNSSDAAVAAGGFLNPLESTTSAFSDIGKGTFNGKTAANLLLPGLGAILNNNDNKVQRAKLQADQLKKQQQQKADDSFKTSLASSFSNRQAGYADGGEIKGAGTSKSDSIKAKIRPGSFVVPAKNAEAAEEIREKVLDNPAEEKAELNQKGGDEVKLSNGEHLFTPEEKEQIIAAGIDLDDLAPDAQNKIRTHLNCGGNMKGYGNGGDVIMRDNKGNLINKDIEDANKRQYDINIHNFYQKIARSGLTLDEYYKKYPNEIEFNNKREGEYIKQEVNKGKTPYSTELKNGGEVKGYAQGGDTGDNGNLDKIIAEINRQENKAKEDKEVLNRKYQAKISAEKDAKIKAKLIDQAREAENTTNQRSQVLKYKKDKINQIYSQYASAPETSKSAFVKPKQQYINDLKGAINDYQNQYEKYNPSSRNVNSGFNYLNGDKNPSNYVGNQIKTTNSNPIIKAPKMTGYVNPATQSAKTAPINNSPFSQNYAANENPNLVPPQTQGSIQTPAVAPTGLASKTAAVNGDLNTTTAASPAATSGASRTGDALSKGLGLAMDYGLPLLQTGLGLSYLNKAGARPVDKLNPDYLNSIASEQGIVARANNNAKFGYTPEEQAYIDNSNANATEANRYAARNLSGGSSANAYVMERDALNNSFNRGLESRIGSRNLQLQKQGYADQKQSELNALLQDKQDRSRLLFGDTMNAFQQNQNAAGNLIGAGLSNLIGASRYRQELDASTKRNQMYNPQYPA